MKKLKKFEIKMWRGFVFIFGALAFLTSCGSKPVMVPELVDVYVDQVMPINNKSSAATNGKGVSVKKSNYQDIRTLIEQEVVIGENALAGSFYQLDGESINTVVLSFANDNNLKIDSFKFNNKDVSGTSLKVFNNNYSFVYYDFQTESKPGYYDYVISDITYTHKDKQMNAKIGAKKGFKVAVKNNSAPYIMLNNEAVSLGKIEIDATLYDPKNLISKTDKFMLYVSDETKIIERLPLKVGANTFSLTNLNSGQSYEYSLVGIYDAFDGTGRNIFYYETRTIETSRGVVFNEYQLNITSSSISFHSEVYSEDINILRFELYDGATNKLLKTNDNQTFVFANLFSNYSYRLVAQYEYMSDGKKLIGQDGISFKTFNKLVPSLNVNIFFNEYREIMGVLDLFDPEETTVEIDLELIQDDKTIQEYTNVDPTYFVFSNLRSGQEYIVRSTLTYDLNDNLGQKVITNDYSARTLEFEEPTIYLNHDDVSTEYIKYSLYFDNPSEVGGIDELSFYHNDKLVEKILLDNYSSWPYTGIFKSLLSNNSYDFVIKYHYDLNDGKGVIKGEYREEIATLAKEVPGGYFYTIEPTYFDAIVDFEYYDYDNVGQISKIELYKNNNKVQEFSYSHSRGDEFYEAFFFENLETNSLYKVKILGNYNLNDGSGTKEIAFTETFQTLKIDDPLLLFENIHLNTQDISFRLTSIDELNLITVDSYALYLGDQVIKTVTSGLSVAQIREEVLAFSNLKSNTKYTITVTYSYDLLDGFGIQRKTINSNNYDYFKNMINYDEDKNVLADSDLFTIANGTIVELNFYMPYMPSVLYINNNVGARVFDGVGGIKEIHLGPNVKVIGDHAFSNMANLTKVYFYSSTPPSFGSDVFAQNWERPNFALYVPENALEAYKSVDVEGWQTHLLPEFGSAKIKSHDKDGYRDVITVKLVVPEPEVKFIDIQNKYVDFRIVNHDPSEIIKITNIAIYDGTTLLDSIDATTLPNLNNLTFDGLTKSENYRIRVQYEYDVNEGAGVQKAEYEIDFQTQALYGKGTAKSPYHIEEVVDLAQLSLMPDKQFILKNDLILSGTWNPIIQFSGVLDGDNHTITNLKFTSNNAAGNYAFIIGNSGTIKNLKFTNVDINLSGSSDLEVSVIALTNSGRIANVHVSGVVSLTTTKNIIFGGISTFFTNGIFSDVSVDLTVNLVADKGVRFAGIATISEDLTGSYPSFEQVQVMIDGKVISKEEQVEIAGVCLEAQNFTAKNVRVHLGLETEAQKTSVISGLFNKITGSSLFESIVVDLDLNLKKAQGGIISGLVGEVTSSAKTFSVQDTFVVINVAATSFNGSGYYTFGQVNAQQTNYFSIYIGNGAISGLTLSATEIGDYDLLQLSEGEIYKKAFFYNYISLDEKIWEIETIDFTNKSLPYLKP